MSKFVYNGISEGLQEALAVTRGQAEPYRVHYPITAERQEGAPAKVGDSDAPQANEAEER